MAILKTGPEGQKRTFMATRWIVAGLDAQNTKPGGEAHDPFAPTGVFHQKPLAKSLLPDWLRSAS
jgi:hypothetical protein